MNHRYPAAVGSVEVTEADDGAPAVFRWRGRRYTVRVVIANWVEALPWWVDQAGGQRHARRHVWRVEAASRTGMTGVYDLYRISRGWGLERVID